MVYELVNLESEVHDTVAKIAGQRLFLSTAGGHVAFTTIPFDVPPSVAVDQSHLYIAPGEAPDVLVFDFLGTLRRVFGVALPTEPLTRARYDHEVATILAKTKDEEQAIEFRRRYGRMPLPERMPVFRRLLVDAMDHLWLEIFRPGPDQRHEWLVFDPTGAVLGRTESPPGVTLEHIGSDFILGRLRDESDVEHVMRYGLRR